MRVSYERAEGRVNYFEREMIENLKRRKGQWNWAEDKIKGWAPLGPLGTPIKIKSKSISKYLAQVKIYENTLLFRKFQDGL